MGRMDTNGMPQNSLNLLGDQSAAGLFFQGSSARLHHAPGACSGCTASGARVRIAGDDCSGSRAPARRELQRVLAISGFRITTVLNTIVVQTDPLSGAPLTLPRWPAPLGPALGHMPGHLSATWQLGSRIDADSAAGATGRKNLLCEV